MATTNDENKKKVEEKYQKFKANHLDSLNVLASIDQNKVDTHSQEISVNDFDFDQILRILPKNKLVFDAMLTDPSIHELSQSLKKQAEQKNAQALINAFPERYKYLLEIQAKYQILEKQAKQKCEKHEKQISNLRQRCKESEQKLRQQIKIKFQLAQMLRKNEQIFFTELSEEIKKKQVQIFSLRDQLQSSQKKNDKLKSDYKNSNNIVIELRDETQSIQKQMQRLVDKLKETQQKLTKAHKKLLQFDNNKKQEIQKIIQKYEQIVKEGAQKKESLQQQMQQLNIRIEYKQSLLKMSENENEKIIAKLQDQAIVRHESIQKLRNQHIQALKTIDELEERVNMQEQQIVRDAQVFQLEKQQLKRQLDKCYQSNGEMKVELDVKSELVRMLQKSIQCLKSSFQTDLCAKNNEWIQMSKQLLKAKTQAKQFQQKTENQAQKITMLESQKISLSQQITQHQFHIKNNEQLLKKYLAQIVEQQQICCGLKWKVEEWLSVNSSTEDHLNDQTQIAENTFKGQANLYKKISTYENIIDKLKQQILTLTNETRNNSTKESKLFKQLMQQNKQLKKQIQANITPHAATKINLFTKQS